METLTIELRHQKAFDLLHDLEVMDIIKVLHRSSHVPQKLSERFAGKLSDKTATDLQNHISESRDSWDKNSI
jgi:hypothetical protein